MSNYYVSLQKAYELDGSYIVQGIASGTLVDLESERMSLKVLKSFADKINLEGIALTNGHQKGGAIDDELGVLNYAELLMNSPEEGQASLFVKGVLDFDNPNCQYLVKAVNKGKKFAFSIEGLTIATQQAFDNAAGRVINTIKEAIPTAITITTKPSYAPSFLEVMAKSIGFEKSATKFTDYPDSARNNAKKVLEWKEKYGDDVKGMTSVGWNRAKQIANGESISRAELGSIASFARHEKNSKVSDDNKGEPWKDAGHVAWLGWGGSSMINWAKSKLESIEKSIYNTDTEKIFAQNTDALREFNISKSQNMNEENKQVTETVEEVKTEVTEVAETQHSETQAETEVTEDKTETTSEPENKEKEEKATEVTEVTEEGEELQKSYEMRKIAGDDTAVMIKSMVSDLTKIINNIDGRISKMEKAMEKRLQTMTKSLDEIDSVQRSFHADIEVMKKLPLQRKALVKSVDTVEERKTAETVKDYLASTY